jgi:RNA polymerase sigma-70 factor, ECF subfamily
MRRAIDTRPSEVTPRRRAIGSAVDATPTPGATAAARPTFAQVYEDQFSFAWRSALRLGTPRANIDDVVQEIFIVAHERLAAFEGRSSVKTWLFGIILNVVRAHRRALLARQPHALRPEVRADPEALPDPAAGPHEQATKAEAARIVDRLLEDLDEDKREVFVMVELEQMSAPEIASALEIPPNTVYSRLRHAREQFAKAAARLLARDRGKMPWTT